MHYEALFEDCYLKQIIAASHKQIKMDFSVPKFIKAIGKNAIKNTKVFILCQMHFKVFFQALIYSLKKMCVNVLHKFMKCTNIDLFI